MNKEKYTLTYNNATKELSDIRELRNKAKEYPYYFISYHPDFVSGIGNYALCFDTENELISYLKEMTKDGFDICMSKDGYICDVLKDGSTWLVRGFTNLSAWAFPNYILCQKVYPISHFPSVYL